MARRVGSWDGRTVGGLADRGGGKTTNIFVRLLPALWLELGT
jgi:hypothetical protein